MSRNHTEPTGAVKGILTRIRESVDEEDKEPMPANGGLGPRQNNAQVQTPRGRPTLRQRTTAREGGRAGDEGEEQEEESGVEEGGEEDYFNANAQRGGRGARRGVAPGRTAQATPHQRRRTPARKQGTGEEEEQEEEELEEDDMEEDYYNTRTSFRDRGARDAPVVEVPKSYAFLLRDLAG